MILGSKHVGAILNVLMEEFHVCALLGVLIKWLYEMHGATIKILNLPVSAPDNNIYPDYECEIYYFQPRPIWPPKYAWLNDFIQSWKLPAWSRNNLLHVQNCIQTIKSFIFHTSVHLSPHVYKLRIRDSFRCAPKSLRHNRALFCW